jgi:hypothetical protein
MMRRARWLTGLAALGLAALVAAPASTTTLLHFDIEEMTAIASVVAVGEVDSVAARWNDAHTKIYTRATITPTEVLKGGSGLGALTVKMIGGRVGRDTAQMPGTPELKQGERVLVFLEPREDGDGYLIVGLFQGLFRLRKGAQGDELLTQDLPPRGVSLIENSATRAATRMLTLTDVRAIVRGGGR